MPRCAAWWAALLLASACSAQPPTVSTGPPVTERHVFAAPAATLPVELLAPADYVMHVHQGNLAEIAVGKLAQAKGQTPLARTLGRVLQTDHAKGDTLVRAVAKARGISLTDALPADAQAELTKLQGLSGKAFDKELATFSMKDHAHEIALAEVESAKSPDATVRELAKKLLPTLKKHLALSEALNRRLGS